MKSSFLRCLLKKEPFGKWEKRVIAFIIVWHFLGFALSGIQSDRENEAITQINKTPLKFQGEFVMDSNRIPPLFLIITMSTLFFSARRIVCWLVIAATVPVLYHNFVLCSRLSVIWHRDSFLFWMGWWGKGFARRYPLSYIAWGRELYLTTLLSSIIMYPCFGLIIYFYLMMSLVLTNTTFKDSANWLNISDHIEALFKLIFRKIRERRTGKIEKKEKKEEHVDEGKEVTTPSPSK